MSRFLLFQNTHFEIFKISRKSFAQVSLKKLPVPQLNQTLEKYLRYLQPLISAEDFKNTETIVGRFAKSEEAKKLQNLLLKRAEHSENWLTKWWTNVAYLDLQDPIVINSNPGLRLPIQKYNNSDDWLKTTVEMLRGLLLKSIEIESNKLITETQKGEPLCMNQFYTLFSTCRIPGIRSDKIYTAGSHTLPVSEKPNFITVVHKNRFFMMEVIDQNSRKIYSKEAMFRGLSKILELSQTKGQPIGLMTAENRSVWGESYLRLEEINRNKMGFDLINKSILLLCLDGTVLNESSSDNPNSLVARSMLHGGGHKLNSANRWFDKTLQLISGRDGALGINYEHTPAEAPPVIAAIEKAYTDMQAGSTTDEVAEADVDSSCVSEIEFSLDSKTRDEIDRSKSNISSLVNDLELHAIEFNDFGKEQIKKTKTSPDAFVQMGIQLGYYSLHNKCGSTYESGSLRRFALGRTDTIRSCSPEAVEFCKTMMSENSSDADRASKLKTALQRHTDYTKEVMDGQGIDRHLLGLKLIALENQFDVPELYMDVSYSKAMHHFISTSQGGSKVDLAMCFGPLVPDGYGFCYNPSKKKILASVSAINSSPETNAEALSKHIMQAWRNMLKLLQ